MADDELQVHGSLGSAGSTNSCLRALAQASWDVSRLLSGLSRRLQKYGQKLKRGAKWEYDLEIARVVQG